MGRPSSSYSWYYCCVRCYYSPTQRQIECVRKHKTWYSRQEAHELGIFNFPHLPCSYHRPYLYCCTKAASALSRRCVQQSLEGVFCFTCFCWLLTNLKVQPLISSIVVADGIHCFLVCTCPVLEYDIIWSMIRDTYPRSCGCNCRTCTYGIIPSPSRCAILSGAGRCGSWYRWVPQVVRGSLPGSCHERLAPQTAGKFRSCLYRHEPGEDILVLLYDRGCFVKHSTPGSQVLRFLCHGTNLENQTCTSSYNTENW